MICRHPRTTVVMPKNECSVPLKPPLTTIATTAPASAMLIAKISPYL